MLTGESTSFYQTYLVPLIAGISLAISLTTLLRNRKEYTRTSRDQLTSLLSKLSDLELEREKFEFENADRRADHHVGQMARKYDHQSWYLARQAVYLTTLISRKHVTDIEYATVAVALGQHGDYEEAEVYWGKAINRAGNRPDRYLHMKGLARQYFTSGSYTSGREKYEEALRQSEGGAGDSLHYVRGELYRSWARTEAEADYSKGRKYSPAELYDRARGEYVKIKSPVLRNRGLDWLDGVKGKFITPQPES